MEGFGGILKRERYYGKRFTCRVTLVNMIKAYFTYYNTRRLQRGLGILTPLEKHELYFAALTKLQTLVGSYWCQPELRLLQYLSAMLPFFSLST